MTISAKIIKDSVAPDGRRLTTFVLKYPRFVHSEFMTHRSFSRNASSSRAIPFKTQMRMIRQEMAMPIMFRENKKGMQAGKALSKWRQILCRAVWRTAGHLAVFLAKIMDTVGAHKQYVNRIVEPFAHISVVVTGTAEAYANFFALRYHPDAQPEICELAKNMWKEYYYSKPEPLLMGSWHLPFVSTEEISKWFRRLGDLIGDRGVVSSWDDRDWLPLIKLSVARCARVSYNKHNGERPSWDEDENLYDRLVSGAPLHASPAEHQARPLSEDEDTAKSGNLSGWMQHRKTLPNEFITKFEEPF